MTGLGVRNLLTAAFIVAAIVASGDITNDVYAEDAWVICTFNSTK